MEGKDAPVVMRVGHQQDEDREPGVSLLLQRPAFERLQVRQMRLGFDTDASSSQHRRPIDPAQITRDRKGRLSSERCPGREPTLEPRQESRLASIADRVAVGIRLAAQPQPDGGTRQRHLQDRHICQHATLDPSQHRVAHPDARGRGAKAQPRADPSVPDLSAELPTEVDRRGAGAIGSPLGRRHRRTVADGS